MKRKQAVNFKCVRTEEQQIETTRVNAAGQITTFTEQTTHSQSHANHGKWGFVLI
jgi:hypothetical protein